jgi:hypothetical protein
MNEMNTLFPMTPEVNADKRLSTATYREDTMEGARVSAAESP